MWLFHPWGCEPEGGVVRPRRSVSHVVGPGQVLKSDGSCWVLSGLVEVPGGSVLVRILLSSRAPIRVHRVLHPGSSGAVGPHRPKSGFRWVSVRTPIWHDRPRQASTGHSTVPYRCTTKIRTPQGPYCSPMGRLGPRRDTTGLRRPAGGTVRPHFIGAPRFGAPMRPSLLSA